MNNDYELHRLNSLIANTNMTEIRVERILATSLANQTTLSYDMGSHLDLLMSESFSGSNGNNSLFHNESFNRCWDVRWNSLAEHMSQKSRGQLIGSWLNPKKTKLLVDYCEVL